LKLAAVDIGSNAIRMQISNVVFYNGKFTIKKLEYVRFPLRLGKDVFEKGHITPPLEQKFLKLMQAFQILIELYDVEAYRICATSALRESANGREIVEKIKQEVGLKIDIIDGQEEANLINKAITKYLDEKAYLHIDVGGGSTELTLYKNYEKIAIESFPMGSVRLMNTVNSPGIWLSIEDWLEKHLRRDMYPITAIGTGGNINKLYELANKKSKKSKSMTLAEVTQVQDEVSAMSMDERMNNLMLNPDRADVIIPAAEIYLHVMRKAKSKKIIVPDVGLKDGMIETLFDENKDKVVK
jgi:exopolyphosphatase/guanosine-5'-triphosphate,3'-diphosphate pyrophosphatase